MSYSFLQVRDALAACGAKASKQILNSVGVARLSLLPPESYSAVVHAAQKHAARASADAVDPFQQQSKENNEAAEQYWNDRNAAQAAGEPMPALPADPHNAKQLEKLGRDQAAMREASGDYWNKGE